VRPNKKHIAQSSFNAGITYPQHIERIIRTGLKTVRE
jgi:hypothetical protein